MDINNEINSFIKEQMGLEAYTTKCTSLFEKFIDPYKQQSMNLISKDSKKVTGCIKVMDDLKMKLGFLSSIKLDMQALDQKDRNFFETPKFLPFKNQAKTGFRIAKKIDELNTTYRQTLNHNKSCFFDLSSEIEGVYEKNVEIWLSSYWQKTNDIKKVSFPLYYYHDSMDSSINLLDGKKYNLETLAKRYE